MIRRGVLLTVVLCATALVPATASAYWGSGYFSFKGAEVDSPCWTTVPSGVYRSPVNVEQNLGEAQVSSTGQLAVYLYNALPNTTYTLDYCTNGTPRGRIGQVTTNATGVGQFYRSGLITGHPAYQFNARPNGNDAGMLNAFVGVN